MAMPSKSTKTEWICSWCGRKEIRGATNGRPMPGTCPSRSTPRMQKPHTWIKNREL